MINKDNKNYQILIVEDNQGDYFLINDYLYEAILSPNLTHVKDFSEFEELFTKKKRPHFHVILLDLSLPDKSGEELIYKAREIASEIPIIVLTGYSDVDFALKSLSLGVSDYLLKDELNPTFLYKSIVYNIERNKNLLKLKISEKKYSNLFQLSPTPNIVFDIDSFKCITINTAAEKLYDYKIKEFKGKSILDLLDSSQAKEKFKKLISKKSHESAYLGKFNQKTKNGEIINTDCYFTPIQYQKHKEGLLLLVDITEKEMLEKKISSAIVQALENEHYDIGAELHDNVCQILVAGLMNLEAIENNNVHELENLSKSRDFIKSALKDIQNLSHRLAPAYFEDITLEESFKSLCDTFNVNSTFKINISVDDEVNDLRLDKDLHLTLYRILQEQLRNILKHAKADNVNIIVKQSENKLNMDVIDNGVGFSSDSRKKGIGMMNMRRRVELLSGNFEITSAPGQGCKISVQIPL